MTGRSPSNEIEADYTCFDRCAQIEADEQPIVTKVRIPASGCYPIGEGLTVAEVQERLANSGWLEFRCDELDEHLVRLRVYEGLLA